MYKRILAATDGSDFANQAVDHAAALAAGLGAQLLLVTVGDKLPVFSRSEIGMSLPHDIYERLGKADAAKARHILDEATAIARRHGPVEKAIHIPNEEPYAGILEAAREEGADLIVLASRSKTLMDRIFIGSQASKVLSLAPIPVLVLKI
ncbi:MAG: universal stress protein [Devosia sp.]|nr:universal stress protein [Devosia sp.]